MLFLRRHATSVATLLALAVAGATWFWSRGHVHPVPPVAPGGLAFAPWALWAWLGETWALVCVCLVLGLSAGAAMLAAVWLSLDDTASLPPAAFIPPALLAGSGAFTAGAQAPTMEGVIPLVVALTVLGVAVAREPVVGRGQRGLPNAAAGSLAALHPLGWLGLPLVLGLALVLARRGRKWALLVPGWIVAGYAATIVALVMVTGLPARRVLVAWRLPQMASTAAMEQTLWLVGLVTVCLAVAGASSALLRRRQWLPGLLIIVLMAAGAAAASPGLMLASAALGAGLAIDAFVTRLPWPALRWAVVGFVIASQLVLTWISPLVT